MPDTRQWMADAAERPVAEKRQQFVLVTFAVNVTQWLMTTPDGQVTQQLASSCVQSSQATNARSCYRDISQQDTINQLIALKHASVQRHVLPPAKPLARLICDSFPYACCLEFHIQDTSLYMSIRHQFDLYQDDSLVLQNVFGKDWARVCHLRPQVTLWHGQWHASEFAVPSMHNEIYEQTMRQVDMMLSRVAAGEHALHPLIPLPARLITGTGINIDAWARKTNLGTTVLHFPDNIIAASTKYITNDIPYILETQSIKDIHLSILFQWYDSDGLSECSDGVFGVLLDCYPELKDLVVFLDDERYGYILARPNHYDTDVALLESMFPGYLIDKFATVCDVNDSYHEQ